MKTDKNNPSCLKGPFCLLSVSTFNTNYIILGFHVKTLSLFLNISLPEIPLLTSFFSYDILILLFILNIIIYFKH